MTEAVTRPQDFSPAIRRWRVALIVVGLALLALGGWVLLTDVKPQQYIGILTWFLGALIIHDGIIAPIVFAIGLGMRRASSRIPFVVLVIVQGALVTIALLVAIVVPEILKKSIGTGNETLLPLDYARNLSIVVVALLALAAVLIGIVLRRGAKRSKAHFATLSDR